MTNQVKKKRSIELRVAGVKVEEEITAGYLVEQGGADIVQKILQKADNNGNYSVRSACKPEEEHSGRIESILYDTSFESKIIEHHFQEYLYFEEFEALGRPWVIRADVEIHYSRSDSLPKGEAP